MANGVSENRLTETALQALADWAKGKDIALDMKFSYGTTLWGTKREFDAKLTKHGKSIALQYTSQEGSGSTFKGISTTILDAQCTKELPILAVMIGSGIPETFKVWASRTGHAIRVEDLPQRLSFYFGV